MTKYIEIYAQDRCYSPMLNLCWLVEIHLQFAHYNYLILFPTCNNYHCDERVNTRGLTAILVNYDIMQTLDQH